MSNKKLAIALILLSFTPALFFTSCAKRHAKRAVEQKEGDAKKETGLASWYGPGFHGRKTASGERFDSKKLTAAHKTLPFGTEVKVTNVDTDESVVVKINDRGPFKKSRIIDLSKAAAKKIGLIARGVSMVVVEILPKSGEVGEGI